MMKLIEMEDCIVDSIKKAHKANNTRLDMIESRLSEAINSFCANKTETVVDDAEDRKRLKERLKEGLAEGARSRPTSVSGKEGWPEYIFGICPPDGRVGKGGSRSN
jgi:hypothetical protein